MKETTVTWFSAGVSSAVATKLAINDIDKIIYIHIEDQHEDTMRFVKDCERWFGKPITILQSPYKTVEKALIAHRRSWINSPFGSNCTKELKRMVRIEWEYNQPLDEKITYIWGMDASEQSRTDRLNISMPNFKHRFPLIEQSISKAHAHEILKASGIKRPKMYELGYHNNNCVGCVKGGMGYWNKIRIDFPEVFKSRSELERKLGSSCINGTFLDELDPERGRHAPPIVDDCGIFCELEAL